jgi:hypothetical protein
VMVFENHSTQSVPKVIESVKTLTAHRARLIIWMNERTAKFHHMGKILFHELVGESKI